MKLKLYTTLIIIIVSVLGAVAQPSLSFSEAEWDFGAIAESDGRVSHMFTGVNVTNKPIVILDIFSSCGCTAPEFSKKPILPGEKSTIKVTFDPTNRPGAFIKELTIYDSERSRAGKLTIRGNVTPRAKTTDELYPVDAGGGLRLSESLCTFSYLYHGKPVMSVVGVINTSSRPLRLELLSEEQSGFLMLNYPRQLAPGVRGEISIGYNVPVESGRYGTVKDVLIPRIDGRDASVRLMAHGVAVDNPAHLNEIYLPKAEIDKYILKFGLLKRTSGLQKLAFTIANKGEGPLTIRAVETEGKVGTTLRKGRRIEAGRSITGYATIDPARQEYGPLSEHITIVTDDPTNPMRRIRVTAVIEE